MITRDDIVRVARGYVGTPFVHQGRVRGVGVDCFGLPICVARDLGVAIADIRAYHERPDGGQFVVLVRRALEEVDPRHTQPGDFLAFWVRVDGEPEHCGVRTYHGLVHAKDSTNREAGKVVEHVMSEIWREHVFAAFRLPGVE